MGREGLCTAAGKSISILEESASLHFQKIDINSPIFRALELFRTFLAELERIDAEAQLTAGWYQYGMFAICKYPLPISQRRREREKGEW